MTKQSAKPKKRDLWKSLRPYATWLIGAAFLVLLLMAAVWVMPTEYPPTLNHPLASINLVYPRFHATGDESVIDVTLTNTSTQAITGTLLLDFGASPPVIEVEDSVNVMKIENLPPDGKQTLHFRYRLGFPSNISGGYLEFVPRLEVEGSPSQDYAPQRVDVPPVPWVRTVLVGTLLVGLVALLGDQLKEHLFPSK
jgi:hypothetical protein